VGGRGGTFSFLLQAWNEEVLALIYFPEGVYEAPVLNISCSAGGKGRRDGGREGWR